jgi:hypothetical protein
MEIHESNPSKKLFFRYRVPSASSIELQFNGKRAIQVNTNSHNHDYLLVRDDIIGMSVVVPPIKTRNLLNVGNRAKPRTRKNDCIVTKADGTTFVIPARKPRELKKPTTRTTTVVQPSYKTNREARYALLASCGYIGDNWYAIHLDTRSLAQQLLYNHERLLRHAKALLQSSTDRIPRLMHNVHLALQLYSAMQHGLYCWAEWTKVAGKGTWQYYCDHKH